MTRRRILLGVTVLITAIGAGLLSAQQAKSQPSRRVRIMPGASLELPRNCTATLHFSTVDAWAGRIDCRESFDMDFAAGLIEPLTETGTLVWQRRLEFPQGPLFVGLLRDGKKLKMTAERGGWQYFTARVKNEADAEEVVRILRTLKGRCDNCEPAVQKIR